MGYRGTALPGIPFDEGRATIRNDGGRVLDDAGAPIPGVYCTGWIKRGPSGVIGTNKKDATETVELLLEDLQAGSVPAWAPARARIEDLLAERGVTSSHTRAGRRSTPSSARRGAAGAPAREAVPLGGAARRSPQALEAQVSASSALSTSASVL